MATVIMPTRKAKSLGLVPTIVSSSVTATSLALPANVTNDQVEFAVIGVESQSVRWRGDAVVPFADGVSGATASSGIVALAGDVIVYTGDVARFRVINAGAALPAAILQVEFYAG